MQANRRYSFLRTLLWQRKSLAFFIALDAVPVALYRIYGLDWLILPWQPISLVGLAVAFYLGFKNNASYERLWEARKTWGTITQRSHTFAIMVRDFINHEHDSTPRSDAELDEMRNRLIRRHLGWLVALRNSLRQPRPWEHRGRSDERFRASLGLSDVPPLADVDRYLSEAELRAVEQKTNRVAHIVSIQSEEIEALREARLLSDFEYVELTKVLGDLFAAQGRCEQIKDFPFPRQYASANYYFVGTFLLLLPFAMLGIFAEHPVDFFTWLAIPFSVTVSMVFWTMEVIGDYSENPFEGLYNDVPVSAMSRAIEIDLLEMIGEPDIPRPVAPVSAFDILA